MSARDVGHKERILLERGQERLNYAVDLARSGVNPSYVAKVYAAGASDILAVNHANPRLSNGEMAALNRETAQLRRMGITV
jgi:hypothetical protein